MGRPAVKPRRIGQGEPLGRAQRVSEMLVAHEPGLRRTARRYALNREDADDAFQRTVEILLRKAPAIDQAGLLRWAAVVARREAFAVGRARRRQFGLDNGPGRVRIPTEQLPCGRPDPASLFEARERVAEAAAELARLKPQERRALGLQAAGCSYAEIQAITGWSYTKVNRCLTEGRAALREVGSIPSVA